MENRNENTAHFSVYGRVYGNKEKHPEDDKALVSLIDEQMIFLGNHLLKSSDLEKKDFTFDFTGEKPTFECEAALEPEQTAVVRTALQTIAAANTEQKIGAIVFHFHILSALSEENGLPESLEIIVFPGLGVFIYP